jgi:hypothetical protein
MELAALRRICREVLRTARERHQVPAIFLGLALPGDAQLPLLADPPRSGFYNSSELRTSVGVRNPTVCAEFD